MKDIFPHDDHSKMSDKKTAMVQDIFSRVALKYDLMNDLMSFGIHRSWKKHFVSLLPHSHNQQILDVAGGTGDIAFRMLQNNSTATVTVCDLNPDMLEVGTKKDEARLYKNRLNWVCGNAENLPFKDEIFDIYTIAFGLRNVTHPERALQEAHRVLKPGGQFFCLEFSKMGCAALAKIYHGYSAQIIPMIGKFIAKDQSAYEYLVESIEKFPNQYVLSNMIQTAGFTNVKHENLLNGVAAVHSGLKL